MTQNFAVDPQIQHHFSDGVYAKQMHLPKGYAAYTHKHAYSHLAILGSGIAQVTLNRETSVYTAPACINIVAGVTHEILALEDITWYCIHATLETDPGKIDEIAIGAR